MSSTNRGAKRRPNDSYNTPPYAVASLLSQLDLTRVGTFLEPCRGSGNIYRAVKAPKKYWCEIADGRDYLAYRPRKRFDLAITNPPYSLAQEFVAKMLQEASTVCVLQRLNFLGSQARRQWWNAMPPLDYLFALSRRPRFLDADGNDIGTDSCEYGWFVWDRLGIVDKNLFYSRTVRVL